MHDAHDFLRALTTVLCVAAVTSVVFQRLKQLMTALTVPVTANAGEPTTTRSEVAQLLHGLGEPVALRLTEHSSAIGRSLAELNLRGLTGASVLAITRHDGGVIIPTGRELLHSGDVLALAGTQDALHQASRLLSEPPASEEAVY